VRAAIARNAHAGVKDEPAWKQLQAEINAEQAKTAKARTDVLATDRTLADEVAALRGAADKVETAAAGCQ